MRVSSENNLMFSFFPNSVIWENVRCDYKVMILIPLVTHENQPCHLYNSSHIIWTLSLIDIGYFGEEKIYVMGCISPIESD